MRSEQKIGAMIERQSLNTLNTDEYTDEFAEDTPTQNVKKKLESHSLPFKVNRFVKEQTEYSKTFGITQHVQVTKKKFALLQYNLENDTNLTEREIFAETPLRRGPDWGTDLASRVIPAVGQTPEQARRTAQELHRAFRMYLIGGQVASAQEDIECRTEGGILRGKVYRPKNPTGQVVLYFTGNGGSFNCTVSGVMRPCMELGATLVAMNYRGYGAVYQDENGHLYNERSETLDDNGNVIETRRCEASICKDGEAMLDYVLKDLKINGKNVEPENVFLHGFSMGGRVASHVAESYTKKQLKDAIQAGRDPRKLGGMILSSPMLSMSGAAEKILEKRLPIGRGLAASAIHTLAGDYDTKTSLENVCRFASKMPVYYTGGGAKKLLRQVAPNNEAIIEDDDFLSPMVTGIDEISFKNRLIEIDTKNNHTKISFKKLNMLLREGTHMGRRQFVNGDELSEQDWIRLKQDTKRNAIPSIPSYDPKRYSGIVPGASRIPFLQLGSLSFPKNFKIFPTAPLPNPSSSATVHMKQDLSTKSGARLSLCQSFPYFEPSPINSENHAIPQPSQGKRTYSKRIQRAPAHGSLRSSQSYGKKSGMLFPQSSRGGEQIPLARSLGTAFGSGSSSMYSFSHY